MNRIIEFRAYDNIEKGYVDDEWLLENAREILQPSKGLYIEQFTGLTDKNGTKIFEGDILKLIRKSSFHKHMDVEVIAKVIYIFDSFKTGTISCKNLSFLNKNSNWFGVKTIDFIHTSNFYESEVIGNINEHAHLLNSYHDTTTRTIHPR